MNSGIYDNTKINGIIKNYTECVGLLNQFFSLIFDEFCGPCIEGNGDFWILKDRGCCITTYGRRKTGGPAAEKIEEIRTGLKNKALADGRELKEDICEYFETGKGCILGDIKPEPCVYTYCNVRKINEKYGINYSEDRIKRCLGTILGDDTVNSGVMKEGMMPGFVQDFKDYVRSMIDSVERVKNPEKASDTDTRPF
jgi:hypothetical protein